MGLKVVGLHSFSHVESDTPNKGCEICEYIIIVNETDVIANNPISYSSQIMHVFKGQNFYAYAYKFEQSLIDNSLFCRPPPAS